MRTSTRVAAVLVSSVVTVAGMATGLVTASASAATQTDTVLEGTISWTRLGHVDGTGINAQSGSFYVNTDEGYISAQVLQWRCPRGVRPPTVLDDSGPCNLLASTDSTPGDSSHVSYAGPLSMAFDGTWDVRYTRWYDGTAGSPTSYQDTADGDVTRVGPLQREVSRDGGTTEVTYTAPMLLQGDIPGYTFPTKGTRQSSDWTRRTYYSN